MRLWTQEQLDAAHAAVDALLDYTAVKRVIFARSTSSSIEQIRAATNLDERRVRSALAGLRRSRLIYSTDGAGEHWGRLWSPA